jgi:hypothetical protein
MAPAVDRTKWDAAVHEDILITAMSVWSPNAQELATMMEKLQEKGYMFTARALRYVSLNFATLHV